MYDVYVILIMGLGLDIMIIIFAITGLATS